MSDPMREQIDLSQRLATDLATVTWPPSAELRRVARRRTRRAAFAGAFSVLLLVSMVWYVGVRPGLSPAAPAAGPLASTPLASAPSATIGPGDPAWIPPEALLTPEDVGPGLVAGTVSVDQNQPIGQWAFTLSPCPEYPRVPRYQGVYQFRREQTVEIPPKVQGRPETGVAVLHQSVMRLPVRAAEEIVGDAREVAQACAKYTASGVISAMTDDGNPVDGRVKVRATHAWLLLDEGFAGDQSLLFEHQMTTASDDGMTELGAASVVVVRVGDLVATVEQVDGQSADVARKLGMRAAAWLCTASTPPC